MGRTRRIRNRLNLDHEQRPYKVDSQTEFIDLCKWMTKEGWHQVANICPAVFHNTGRGLMALSKLSPNSLLVRIPENLLITKARVLREIPFLKQYHMTSADCLTFFILYSKTTSRFCAYIATLPPCFSVGGMCLDHEIETLPSVLQEKIVIQKEYVFKKYEKISSVWENMFGSFLSLELFQWAWFCVNTRAVFYRDCDGLGIPGSDNNMALAPYLDMFNHDSSVSVEAGFNSSNHCYEIRSVQKIDKYAQIFISYGPHNNQKLYLEYGFITENNPHNIVEFGLRNILELFPYENIRSDQVILLNEISKNRNLFVSQDGLSWDAQVALTVLTSGDSEQYSQLHSPFQILPDTSKIESLSINLVENLRTEFLTSLEKTSKVGDDCSSSFLVAKLLIQDLIFLLNRSMLLLKNECNTD